MESAASPAHGATADIIRTGADRLWNTSYLQTLSDSRLTQNLRLLAAAQNRCTAAIVGHLIELDRRDLTQRLSMPSLFVYCMRELGLTEDVACRHIVAVRAAQRFPSILGALARGELKLTVLCIVNRHLTAENHRSLLSWATGKSKREVERRVAELEISRLPPREVIRHLPPSSPTPIAQPPDEIPLFSPDPAPPAAASQPRRLVRIAFAAEEEFLARFERAKALLKHKFPAGAIEDILGELVYFFLTRRDPALKRRPAAPRPSPGRRRRIAQWIKDAVWRRDKGRCAYASVEGGRCPETAGLEYDHVRPWSRGGASDDPANIRLLCRSHNQAAARRLLRMRRRRL